MPSSAGQPVFRRLSADDIADALALSHAVGWPHRAEDWRASLDVGHGFAALLDGTLVGTAMLLPFEPGAATVALVIVSPTARGRGLAKRLMHRVIEAAAGRTLILNATAMAVPLYEAVGFARTGMVHQHEGKLIRPPSVAPPAGATVRALRPGDVGAINALDHRATGLDRSRALEPFHRAGRGHVLERDGGVAGFALVRDYSKGRVLGPLVAGSQADARTIAAHALAPLAGTWARIDIHADSGLGPWLTGLGLVHADDVTPMILGPRPDTARDARVFALASHAYG